MSSSPAIPVRGLQLDLKGLAPMPPRLLSLLRLASASGYNAVIVEWEDAFPWTCDPRYRAKTAYSAETVAQFHHEATRLHLDVIPLVQCLGHMETPLSQPGNERLRE